MRSEEGTIWTIVVWGLAVCAGCGTTRMSDTARTGTEQLLLSTAIDRAINQMDFKVLAGKEVFFDRQYLKGATDEGYIISTLRQHLLASGAILRENREDATYVVEARSGAVGTNRQEVLLGVPSVSVPNIGLTGVPSAIPEIPFAKTTDQRGVAKLSVYAYNQETGMAVWQSGAFPITTTAKDTWVFGSGPFQQGTIYEGTKFAGKRIRFFGPKQKEAIDEGQHKPDIPVTAEAVFIERPMVARVEGEKLSAAPISDPNVAPAGHVIRLPSIDHDLSPDTPAAEPGTPRNAPKALPAVESADAVPSESSGWSYRIFNPMSWFDTRQPATPPASE